MTHQHREGARALARPPLISTTPNLAPPPPAAALQLDPHALAQAIAARQRTFAEMEQSMVAACEAAAARGTGPDVILADRATWDRGTWTRYLAAATRLEPEYGPRLQRLLSDIDRLARLMTLPAAGGSAA